MYFDNTLFRGKANTEEVPVPLLADAIESLNQAITCNPKVVDAYLQRGRIYCLLDKYEEADKDLTAAIDLDPEYPDNFRMRGLIRFLMERYRESIDDFTNAISLYSGTAITFGYRANAYLALNDFASALVDLEYAIQLEPNNKRWNRKKQDVIRRLQQAA